MPTSTEENKTKDLEKASFQELIFALEKKGCQIIHKSGKLFTPGHEDGSGIIPGIRGPIDIIKESEAKMALQNGYRMGDQVNYLTIIPPKESYDSK